MYDFHTHARDYQRAGVEHLASSHAHGGAAALWLDPGYGKTSITLHAFKRLRDAGRAKTMLVVAPLRVAQTVWAQEIQEWSSLHGLRAELLHGTPKRRRERLRMRGVDIWIINYEGLPWLSGMFRAGKFAQPDVVCFDEVRRMKNAQGLRFKMARPIADAATYRWGLTGTPVANGLLDLFGQFLILDRGEALGKYITKYRSTYFEQGYDGFTWQPRPGAHEAIMERLKSYVFRVDGKVQVPTVIEDRRKVTLDTKALKTYKDLEKTLVAEFAAHADRVTAANAAALGIKLRQIASGRVYADEIALKQSERKTIEIHTAKQDALRELVEELGDEQLFIAYDFRHSLDQIRDVLGQDTPYIGPGVNEKTALRYVEDWNARRIQFLAGHPASVAHGLNLQKGSARHILWWAPTSDLDHYIQFNDRIVRSGNRAESVVIHTFMTEKTCEEHIIPSRESKDSFQIKTLKSVLSEEQLTKLSLPSNQKEKPKENYTMTQLSFTSDANQPAANPFGAQAAPAATTNPFGAQAAPAATTNPFGAQAAPAPAANPFGAQAAPAPAANPFGPQAAPTATANPFGGEANSQPVAIIQDVEGPAIPQPDPASAPPAPVTVQEEAKSQVKGVQAEPSAGAEPFLTTAAPVVGTIPFFTMIPAEKLDKVIAAVGRALK